MKAPSPSVLAVAVLMWLGWPACGHSQLQSVPLNGPVTGGFAAVTYFAPPDGQLVKYRMTGTELTPLSETNYDLKNVRIEGYDLAGDLQTVVASPQCIYSPDDKNEISSASHLSALLKGGMIRLEGDGFAWQTNGSLYISNNVTTLIQPGTNSLIR